MSEYGIVDCEAILSVIIGIRVSDHYDMVSRLKYRMLDTRRPKSIKFLVIDEGSSKTDAAKLRSECESLGFSYHRVDSGKPRFCAATARNAGAAIATTPYIMHEDVDLFPYPGFYQDLLEEIDIQELEGDATRFISVPAIYLTEEASNSALAGQLSKNAIINDVLINGKLTRTYLPASSAIVLNRAHYLAIGGYNGEFDGWGLEDLEFAYRITEMANTFVKPFDNTFLVEQGFSISAEYRGWRARFRLHGDLLARKGIVIFHAYHPKNSDWSNRALHQANKQIFRACIEKFEAGGSYLAPIPAPPKNFAKETSSKKRVLDFAAPIYDLFRNWVNQNHYSEIPENFQFAGTTSQMLSDARKLFQDANFTAAALAFDAICKKVPNNAAYHREAAEAHYRAGQKSLAIQRLKTARDLRPTNKAIRRRLWQMKAVWLPDFLKTEFKINTDE